MDPNEDLYSILEVPSDASQGDIKRSFRRLSMMYHPDRNSGDPNAGARFAKIKEAYDILGNDKSRKEYDSGRLGADGQERMGVHGIPEEIFAAMFGGGGGMAPGMAPGMSQGMPPGMAQGMSQGMPMDGFGDMGGVRVFHVGGMPPGMGFPGGMPMQGEAIPMNVPMSDAGPIPEPATVPDLEEHVKIPIEKAFVGCKIPVTLHRSIIQGQIEKEEKETIYVSVPCGADNGEIVRVSGKGNSINGKLGDVKVFVEVTNDTEFKRDGMDLIYTKTLSLKEALKGASFDISHLDNRVFRLKGTGTIASPHSFRHLKGLGMKRDGKTGNLIVKYNIEFPLKLSEEQLAQLDQIL